ncbi:hypothetical protein PWG71_08390 [Nocardiopsis sp. N85]|uniref:hypothetical protein n=1 Tax=Nocardiopsis sp. N85 TaxID=3029400 RepID=UPI00237F07C9|nr:hypothetical protein [Nocardiopsis sp. N85]MDE3721405.1 hypothetical protein [Nocardiopsis sp. N85]
MFLNPAHLHGVVYACEHHQEAAQERIIAAGYTRARLAPLEPVAVRAHHHPRRPGRIPP